MNKITDTRLAIALCAGLLFFSGGCSINHLLKDKGPDKQWTCRTNADNALANQDFETAVHEHKDLLEDEPQNGLALYHLGYAYGQKEQKDEEIYFYEMAISYGFFENGIFFNLGMAYGEQDLIEKAINTFTKGIEVAPNNSDNHFGLAMVYQKNKSNRLAETEYLKAIELDSKSIEARLQLGMLYSEMDDNKKAKDQFTKALEIDPGNIMLKELLISIESRQ